MFKVGFKALKRLPLLAFVAVLCVVAVQQPAHAAKHHYRHSTARHSTQPQPDRFASIVVDAETGTVLSEKNADLRRYPASLSKMMTLYLTFEALRHGTVTKNQRLPISANAEYQEPSKLGLKQGYTIRLEDAIYAVVTKSANDAAVTLGEAIGGSESHFARLMTFKAQQLGMRGTHFVNASGLHDPLQYSTARDIAILAQALIRDFPEQYHYFSTPSFTFAGLTFLNHNKLMQSYPGMDGLKTGYVHASGYNLAASAVHDGRRLIGVVFGGRTASSRNQTMAQLLDAGFERLKEPRVAAAIAQREKLAAARVPRRRPASAAFAAAQPVDEGEGDENDPSFSQRAALPQTASEAARQFLQPKTATKPQGAPVLQPPRLAVAGVPAAPAPGSWSVQIGAYSSHDASLMALRNAKEELPSSITTTSSYIVVPLMTNRGVIYRARLGGLTRPQAETACRVLQRSCVVLATE